MNDQNTTKPETRAFQTEVAQLLHLVTHSLYSNKEIFLRELISNASDAADKLRYLALSNASLYENDPDLKIWVDIDKDARTVSVRDNGIGMNRDEIIEHLGTIAKSGTKAFLKQLTESQAKDRQLIGQFGVGFYSAFVVADRVTVHSRRAGDNASEGVTWASEGTGEFTVESTERPERGTEITLHLKESEDEFLEDWRLRSIISKYSDHIMLPIIMKKPKVADESSDKAEDKPKKDKPVECVEEVVNQATALWTQPRNEITDEQYKTLYKHISHDFADPLAWTHNRVEGKLEYISLLYLPSQVPFELFNPNAKQGLKLYAQRVFVMDDAKQLLPHYLRFVRGVVDSNDLPLNVSREMIQNNKIIDSIRSGCARKVLELLEKMAKEQPEDYKKCWTLFGQVLKEGPVEDFANKDRIAKLLRFASTHVDEPEQTVSLDAYLGRMKEGQDKIYYVTAEQFNAAKNSPHLEIFRKKGIEVLLMCDRVDEWLMGHLTEYEGKPLQSVAKSELNLDKVKSNSEENQTQSNVDEDSFKDILERMKRVLGERVDSIRLSSRLTDSPACLVMQDQDMSLHLKRMLKDAGHSVPESQPILEINPEHPLVNRLKVEPDELRFMEWSEWLFEQALLAEGGQLNDPAGFVKRLNKMLLQDA